MNKTSKQDKSFRRKAIHFKLLSTYTLNRKFLSATCLQLNMPRMDSVKRYTLYSQMRKNVHNKLPCFIQALVKWFGRMHVVVFIYTTLILSTLILR